MLTLMDHSVPTNRTLQLITKELAFQKVSLASEKIKLVISSSFLGMAGWKKGTRVLESVIGLGKGIMITKAKDDETHDKVVYDRGYKNRSERETVMDIRHQGKLLKAFLGASRARIEITEAYVRITPVKDVDSATSTFKGASIEIPTDFASDTVINVLNTIKQLEITNAEIMAQQAFWEGTDGNLLKIQLRRAGYQMDQNEGVLSVFMNQDNAGHLEKVEIMEPIKATAPPAADIAANDRLNTFVGLSGGVDAHLLEKEGFRVTHGLEYRPQEARDKTDKTEAYALSLAINTSLHTLFNENIWTADIEHIGQLSQHIPHAHYSLSCTDYSPLKNAKAKAKAWEELTTTRDMFVRLLELIAIQQPLTLSVENVTPFGNSREGEIFAAGLESLGYHVWRENLKAPTFGGLTTRDRHYVVASLLAPVVIPTAPAVTPEKRNAWEEIAYDFDNMRCITQTSGIQKGIETGRIRPMTEGAALAPTLARSQNRGVKDQVSCRIGDEYYAPTLEQIRTLMGIPKSFDLSFLSKELSVEAIGQSVDAPMHRHLATHIKQHIEQHLGTCEQMAEPDLVAPAEVSMEIVTAYETGQMVLFA